jgi:hypothetical protein
MIKWAYTWACERAHTKKVLRKNCKFTDEKTKLKEKFYLIVVDKGAIFQNL